MSVAKKVTPTPPFQPTTETYGAYMPGEGPMDSQSPLPVRADVPLAAFGDTAVPQLAAPESMFAYPSGTVTSGILEGYGAFDSPAERAAQQGVPMSQVRVAYDVQDRIATQTPAWYRYQYDKARAVAEGRMTQDGQYVDDMLSSSERAVYAERDSVARTQRDVIANIIGYEFTQGAYRDIGARLGPGILGPYVDSESRMAWLSSTYPGVADAIVQAGGTPQDIAHVSDIMVAKSAAEDIIIESNRGNDFKARQIMAALPVGIGVLAGAMVEEQYKAAVAAGSAAAADSADKGESPVTTAGRFVWNAIPGPAINALMAVNETALHAVRTVMMATELAASEALYDGSPVDVAGKLATRGLMAYAPQAWRQTEQGYLNPYTMKSLASEYGDKETAVMTEAYRANQSEDSSAAWEALWAKYDGDPEAMRILTAGMNTDEFIGGDRTLSDLYVRIAAADQGNLGNLITTAAHMDPTWGITMGVRDASNVGSAFLFDPLLAGGKALRVYKYARYGIYKMANTASVEKAFTQRGVQNWFDWYGGEIRKVADTADSTERGRKMTTLLSQSKRFADADMAAVFLKHKVYDAESAKSFLMGMDTVDQIVAGKPAKIMSGLAVDVRRVQTSMIRAQSAKRYNQVYTPHMTAAAISLKQASAWARRGADLTKFAGRSTPVMDNLLGADFTELSVAQQNERLTNLFLDNAKVDALASELSDFTGGRTLAGYVIKNVTRTPEWDAKLENAGVKNFFDTYRMGWRRKGFLRFGEGRVSLPEAMSRKVDRWSRLMARMPDSRNGLMTADASDADKVYQMMRLAGVPRSAASEFRSMWITMDEGQRQLAYIGLVRTYARASGIHLVDPRGMDNVMETITGVRTSELHAPDQVERFGALMRDIDNEAQALHKSMLEEARQIEESTGGKAAPVPDVEELKKTLVLSYRAQGSFNKVFNPSVKNSRSSAIFLPQTSDRVAMPNFSALDAITARQSYLNLLLFANRAGSDVTNWWTFATLYGPKFQLRNGVEDIGLFALTGGTLGQYMTGRPISTVIRESTERLDNRVVAARQEWIKVTDELNVARKTKVRPEKIASLEAKAQRAEARFLDYQERYGGRGKKLGIVNTARTRLSSWADSQIGNEGDFAWKAMRAFLGPTTTKAEREAAALGGREAVADLNVEALMRQRLYVVRDKDARGLALKLQRGATLEEMSPAQQQILADMNDLVRSPFAQGFRDEAAETSRHLVDATMPTVDDMADLSMIRGQVYQTARINGSYDSQRIVGTVKPRQAQAMYVSLSMAMGDGPKSQASMYHLQRYWNAVNAPGASNVKEMEAVIDDVLAWVKNSKMWPVYVERFRLSNQTSERDLIKSTLDTLTGTFTTTDGTFNKALWKKMRAVGDDGKAYFRLFEEVDGEVKPIVKAEDFLTGDMPIAANVLVYNSDELTLPVVDTWMDRRWSEMGRSLARMTREPIWYANYMDARKVYRPFEKQWAKMFGEESARQKATELAGERAYMLTMAYVDNPAVRSQMAWAVRNIARFYRASEDFARRMWRTARNNPMAFWRASLAWNASQDSGFVYSDDYGDSYFMYPMSRAGMELMNDALNIMGGSMKMPGLPMGMSGKVQWLTPSADPDSWWPTLSSPYAAILYRPALRSLPGLDTIGKAVDKALFGSIGSESNLDVNLPGPAGEMVKALPYALPPVLNKLLLGVVPAAIGVDAPGSYAAKAGAQAVLALGAAGYLPTAEMVANPDGKDAQEYLKRVDFTATAIAGLSLIFGLMAPSAPQLAADNMTQMGRDSGFANLRPAFFSLMRQTMKDGGTWMDAVIKWTQDDPDKAIFTLSQSQAAEYGYMEPVTGNADFVQNNKDIWDEYPSGMTFFAPNTGENTQAAFRILKALNASPPKPVAQYAMELVTQAGYIKYQINRAEYQDALNAAQTDEDRAAADAAWSDTLAQLNSGEFKGLDTRLNARSRTSTTAYRDIATEARYAALALAERGNEKAKSSLRMFDEYAAALNAMPTWNNPDKDQIRSDVKATWDEIVVKELAARPDDDQYRDLLYTLTKALDSSWTLGGR